jgi:hypothetical protein
MKTPTDLEVKTEGLILDKITLLLDRTEFKRGLTARRLAIETGYAIGKVQEVLKKSECILKQRPYNRWLWYNDWKDCDPDFRPKRKRGRRKKPEHKPQWVL